MNNGLNNPEKVTLKGEDFTPLGHLDIIKEGDMVFDDFGKPMFTVGPNHERVGTEFDAFIDMPIYRFTSKVTARMEV